MLTRIKLVQNTHCSLKCWYRTTLLLIRRKTNADRNQTGAKYTLVLTKLVSNQSGIQKNKCKQEYTGAKIHTPPYNAGMKSVWYSEKNEWEQESNWCKNTHWSLQCWYRISLVFTTKPNANRNQTAAKYTLVLTMLVSNQSGIQNKNKCKQK